MTVTKSWHYFLYLIIFDTHIIPVWHANYALTSNNTALSYFCTELYISRNHEKSNLTCIEVTNNSTRFNHIGYNYAGIQFWSCIDLMIIAACFIVCWCDRGWCSCLQTKWLMTLDLTFWPQIIIIFMGEINFIKIRGLSHNFNKHTSEVYISLYILPRTILHCHVI